MKYLNLSWKVGLLVVGGFVVCAILIRPPLARGLPQKEAHPDTIKVYSLSVSNPYEPRTNRPTTPSMLGGMANADVVGFTCIPDSNQQGDAICYIATR